VNRGPNVDELRQIHEEIRGSISRDLKERCRRELEEGRFPWSGLWLPRPVIVRAAQRLRRTRPLLFAGCAFLLLGLAALALIESFLAFELLLG
jgi:hypothetical protein